MSKSRVNKFLSNLLKKQPSVVEKTTAIDPQKLAQAEAQAQLTDFLSKFALAEEKALKKEARLAPALDRLNKTKALRELSGFERWAEGGETSQSLRDRLRREFELGKTEGAKDIDLSKLKNTAAIGGLAVGAGLLGSPEEAKAARYDRIPRKVLESMLRKSKTFDDFLNLLKYEAKNSQLASQDTLHHLILDRTGLPEGKELDAIRLVFPETENIPIDGDLLEHAKKYIQTDPDHYQDLVNNTFGLYRADPLSIGKRNPSSGKISYDPDKFKQGGLAAVLAHEAQHLRDDILFPGAKTLPYAKNWSGYSKNLFSNLNDKQIAEIEKIANIFVKTPREQLRASHITALFKNKHALSYLNQILSIEDLLSMGTGKHHVAYPKNYEFEKSRELVEKGIVPVNKDDLLSRMDELKKDYLKEANQHWFGKTAAGIAAATGIGAGTMAASNSAHASEDSTVSQSNPEFSSSTTSKTLKDAASEEQGKSKLSKALESYGTGTRSAVSSATLGISEPIVSGLSAAIGSLIEAGFDAKDAVEFIKKASEIERFKKNYEEDVAHRKKMQEEHPVADISGSLVGAFSPVGPAAGATKLTEKAVRSVIPAIKAAQEAKGLKAAATRIGGNVLEGGISTPVVTGAENATKRLFGNKEEYNPFEDALMGGAFGGVLSGAMEAGKAIGGRKVAGTLGALGLAAGLSGDNAQAKEQTALDLTEDQKNELRWRSIMRQINKKSSEM